METLSGRCWFGRACVEHGSMGPAPVVGRGWVWGVRGESMFHLGWVSGGCILRCRWHVHCSIGSHLCSCSCSSCSFLVLGYACVV